MLSPDRDRDPPWQLIQFHEGLVRSSLSPARAGRQVSQVADLLEAGVGPQTAELLGHKGTDMVMRLYEC
jgi:hypothetical protein